MPDHRNIDALAQQNAPQRRVAEPAIRAVPRSVPDVFWSGDIAILNALHTAALSADRVACSHALETALASGISREEMADFYIPTLARLMGDQWCADELGFANVTIGVSRLQTMLRDLGPEWSGDNSADAAAPAIMLVVPKDAYHTLGAMVLAGQLRRKGLSVRMMLGTRSEEITDRIKRTRFDAVFISASRGENLETLRKIVDVAKTATDRVLPVVIGGTLLEIEENTKVTALTGADFATTVPDDAIELCGLKTAARVDAYVMRRT